MHSRGMLPRATSLSGNFSVANSSSLQRLRSHGVGEGGWRQRAALNASCSLAGTAREKVPWLPAFRFVLSSQSDGVCAKITRRKQAAARRLP